MLVELKQQFIELFSNVFVIVDFFADTVFIWLPIVLALTFANMWMRGVRAQWISNIDWVMLEIKLPREIRKTPQAMEVALGAFYQSPSGKWPDHVFKGRLKNWFSLELVSIEGDVKFFIRTPKIFKDVIEAQIYSQYPTVEIHEVPDYTKYVDYKGKDSQWSIWGTEFTLQKEDSYPIKTYVDYGGDKEGTKEEEKVDPMTGAIEYLGSLGKGEQAWIQILVQPTGKRFKKPGTWFGKQDWKDQGEALIEKILAGAKKRGGGENSPPLLTKVEEKKIDAIQRSISKLGFDCGIRGIYFAREGSFRVPMIFGMIGAFRQYNSNELNGFTLQNPTSYNYPWQDYKEIRTTKLKRRMVDAYKRRSYFYIPYRRKPFTLNTEELATIFHFPGGVAETPTFGRIESRKGEPPTHLPIT